MFLRAVGVAIALPLVEHPKNPVSDDFVRIGAKKLDQPVDHGDPEFQIGQQERQTCTNNWANAGGTFFPTP